MDTFLVNTADQPIAAVSGLATDLTDVINGYETMLEKAEPELKPMLERLLTLHENHAARLLELYAELGGKPDSAGSLMGTVHSAVAHARDLTGTLDDSARDAILRGEERILDRYRSALEDANGHEPARSIIAEQFQALNSHVQALQA